MGKTYSNLRERSQTVRNELEESANSAQRVGSLFEDLTETSILPFDPEATYKVGQNVIWENGRIVTVLQNTTPGQTPVTHPQKWKGYVIDDPDQITENSKQQASAGAIFKKIQEALGLGNNTGSVPTATTERLGTVRFATEEEIDAGTEGDEDDPGEDLAVSTRWFTKILKKYFIPSWDLIMTVAGNISTRTGRIRNGMAVEQPFFVPQLGNAAIGVYFYTQQTENGLPNYDFALATQQQFKDALANKPPVPPSITTQTGTEGIPYTQTLPSYFDPDGSAINLKNDVAGVPPGMVWDKPTNKITGTPTIPGTYDVIYSATDAQGASSSMTFQIVIKLKPVPNAITRLGVYRNNATKQFVALVQGSGPIEVKIEILESTTPEWTDTAYHPMLPGDYQWEQDAYNQQFVWGGSPDPVGDGYYVRVTATIPNTIISVEATHLIADGNFNYARLFPGNNNLLLNKPARQSSTLTGGEAGLANDGNLATNNHTLGEPQSWWEGDLGRAFVIERIIIRNRTDSPEAEARLRDFYYYFSNQAHVDGAGTLSSMLNSAVKYYYQTGQAGASIDVTLPQKITSRYVGVQLTGGDPLHLIEMEAYGYPADTGSELQYKGGITDQQATEGQAFSYDIPNDLFTGSGITYQLFQKLANNTYSSVYEDGFTFNNTTLVLANPAMPFGKFDDTATTRKQFLRLRATDASNAVIDVDFTITVSRAGTSAAIDRTGHSYNGAGLFLMGQSNGSIRGRIVRRVDGVWSGSTAFAAFRDFGSQTADGKQYNRTSNYIENVAPGKYEVEWDSGVGTQVIQATIDLTSQANYSKQDYPATGATGSISAFSYDEALLLTQRKLKLRAVATGPVQFDYDPAGNPDNNWLAGTLVGSQYEVQFPQVLTPGNYTREVQLTAEPSVQQSAGFVVKPTEIQSIGWGTLDGDDSYFVDLDFENGAQFRYQVPGEAFTPWANMSFTANRVYPFSDHRYGYSIPQPLVDYTIEFRPAEQLAGYPERKVSLLFKRPANVSTQIIYTQGQTTGDVIATPSATNDAQRFTRPFTFTPVYNQVSRLQDKPHLPILDGWKQRTHEVFTFNNGGQNETPAALRARGHSMLSYRTYNDPANQPWGNLPSKDDELFFEYGGGGSFSGYPQNSHTFLTQPLQQVCNTLSGSLNLFNSVEANGLIDGVPTVKEGSYNLEYGYFSTGSGNAQYDYNLMSDAMKDTSFFNYATNQTETVRQCYNRGGDAALTAALIQKWDTVILFATKYLRQNCNGMEPFYGDDTTLGPIPDVKDSPWNLDEVLSVSVNDGRFYSRLNAFGNGNTITLNNGQTYNLNGSLSESFKRHITYSYENYCFVKRSDYNQFFSITRNSPDNLKNIDDWYDKLQPQLTRPYTMAYHAALNWKILAERGWNDHKFYWQTESIYEFNYLDKDTFETLNGAWVPWTINGSGTGNDRNTKLPLHPEVIRNIAYISRLHFHGMYFWGAGTVIDVAQSNGENLHPKVHLRSRDAHQEALNELAQYNATVFLPDKRQHILDIPVKNPANGQFVSGGPHKLWKANGNTAAQAVPLVTGVDSPSSGWELYFAYRPHELNTQTSIVTWKSPVDGREMSGEVKGWGGRLFARKRNPAS